MTRCAIRNPNRKLSRLSMAGRRWLSHGLWLSVIAISLLACGQQPSPPVASNVPPLPTSIAIVPSPATVASATPPPTATPIPAPTPPCVQPVLTLGSAKFRIVTLARAADGSLGVLPDSPDTGYWVEGTTRPYVFALRATANNLALRNSLKTGAAINIRWGDCSSEDFAVSSLMRDNPDPAKLFDQAASGLSVVILGAAPEQTLMISASRPQPQAATTPEPTEVNAVQAELSFLGQQTTADGKSLVMSVALKNTGGAALTLANKDLSLSAEDATPGAPLTVTPALPQTIAPGASLMLQITFAKPEGHAAVFRLLTFSADVYY